MKIVTVVGARPQFVKASSLSRAMAASELFEEIILHTGQHYDDAMSNQFFDELAIPQPRHNLNIGSASHAVQTARMLEGIEAFLESTRPEAVVVFGDTNSTLAGALAASKLHVPVAHVEAGLRSFNRQMPEEINRILTDHASDVLFAPTSIAVSNLAVEGLVRRSVHNVGDVMYDATLYYTARALSVSRALKDLDLAPERYVLATVHRAENTDDLDRLSSILRALGDFAAEMPVVLPLHPRTRDIIARHTALSALLRDVTVVPPFGYLDMTALEHHAALIVTDSGGVQKEAFFHRVPCVTLRTETEWTELVELRWNRLCPPTSSTAILDALRAAIGTRGVTEAQPYGDGQAAVRIVSHLAAFLRDKEQ